MPRPNTGPHLAVGRKGYWVIRWTERGNSRERSTRTRDRSLAQRILADFLILVASGKAASADERPTVAAIIGNVEPEAEATPSYWHEHVLKKVVGVDTQRRAARHLLQHFGPMLVEQVRPEDVAAYIARRQRGDIGKPSVGATIRRELAVLTAACNHAARAKRISPADVPAVAAPESSPPRDRWLTQEECDRLLTAARGDDDKLPRVYLFVALALATASRKRALEQMRWNQIDFAAGMIRLNPAGRAQTKKRRPPVPIADWLLPILVQAKAEAKTDYVLIHTGNIRKAFAAAVKRAGLADVTPHTLRHTWATLAAQRGVSLFEIAGVTGDSVKTIEKNYLHHCPEHLRGAVNAVRMAA